MKFDRNLTRLTVDFVGARVSRLDVECMFHTLTCTNTGTATDSTLDQVIR